MKCGGPIDGADDGRIDGTSVHVEVIRPPTIDEQLRQMWDGKQSLDATNGMALLRARCVS